jgi:hypothetical protein
MSEKVKILFLSASPEDWEQVEADKEFRKIFEKHDDRRVRILSVSNMQTMNLHNVLLKNNPEIIHFSGHGIADEILFEDAGRNGQGVAKDALINLFRKLPKKPRIVFFNACWTAVNIESLSQIIDFVVATREEVSDAAAKKFAAKFYEILFLGTTIKTAFDLAVNYFETDGLKAEVEMYELFIREGVRDAVLIVPDSSEADKSALDPNSGINIRTGNIDTRGGDFNLAGGNIYQYKYTK